ncbi:cytochrome P450 [Epithele typhae]|uniref:cytochrome P450 n=1 Tax=Epithele typhae TaxID=378194 RepID=UPI002008DEC6|nr:cytochrome P450 [Epithele typhae]KAH9916560.1 cytochrome P450 [Epithele typhae]
MDALSPILTPVGLAAFLFFLLRLSLSHLNTTQTTKQPRPLPPGPVALPVLGNVHQLPQTYQEQTFAEWGKQYGEVVYAKIFQRPVLILNTLRAAQELLEKKSSNFSDRPRLILLAELMGWDNVVTHLKMGERHKRHRKWMHDNFQTKSALDGYRTVQLRETYTFLAGLLDTPADFLSHINRWSTGIIMDITYGHQIASLEDPYSRLAHRTTTETVRGGSPGSMLVDFFPLLKELPTWGPGAGFKRNAFRIRALVEELMNAPYELVRSQIAAGTARPSFTASLLEETFARGGPTAEEADDIKGAAGAIFAAGSETTVTVLSNVLLALVMHPEAFARAQAEMDRVVGRARVPDLDDRGGLPYLDAVLAEVLRWRCPVPLAIPHNTRTEDSWNGFRIPGDTMVVPNCWNMTQDPAAYPAPHAFRPERWLEMDPATADARHPRRIVFGFGRRLCPGREFAEANVWLAAAGLVALFDVRAPAGVAPAGEYHSGFVSQPKPFACEIRPRGADCADLIEKARTALAV